MLNLKENFLLVEEIEEQPANGDVSDSGQQFTPVLREECGNSTEEKTVGMLPGDDPVGQVDYSKQQKRPGKSSRSI